MEELSGVGFINRNNEIDVVINVENESVLLSEMRASGVIENCGWFSKLIKRVVKFAIVSTTVAVVAAATGGIAVATAGLACPALIGAGVGVTVTAGSTIGRAIAGTSAGILFASRIGMAAVKAGTAIAEVVGEGIEQVVDKISNDVLALRWQGVEYAFMRLTVVICNSIKYGGYRITLINSNESCIRIISSTAIPYAAAVAFLRVAKTLTEINYNIKSYYSLYHYSQDVAYAVA